MEPSAEELGARFVVTYYRMIYRSPEHMIRLFDPEGCISRIMPSEKIQHHPMPNHPISPIDPHSRILKITSYSTSLFLGNLVISVRGFSADSRNQIPFTQQFVLKQMNQKWMVISDTYYEFGVPRADLVSIDAQPSAPRPGVPHSATRDKKASVNELDPSRTVTLIDLPRQYQGDELVRMFSAFGVSRQFYTNKTVYIEFETVQGRDDAFASTQPGAAKRPMYKGSYLSLVKGIAPAKGAPRS
jgi:hypothetical protein